MKTKSKKKTTQKSYTVYKVFWEESEQGWGVNPDGYSLHLTKEDFEKYLHDYNKTLPKKVPLVYERPSTHIARKARISRKVYQQLKKSKNGIRFY